MASLERNGREVKRQPDFKVGDAALVLGLSYRAEKERFGPRGGVFVEEDW